MNTDPLSRLTAALTGLQRAQDDVTTAVQAARDAGLSWAQIGTHLGVTRQAVWERFAHLTDPRPGDPVAANDKES